MPVMKLSEVEAQIDATNEALNFVQCTEEEYCERLRAQDRRLVDWFASKGIVLVVDRDPITRRPNGAEARQPVVAQSDSHDKDDSTNYSLDVVVGDDHYRNVMSLHYGGREMADRAFVALAAGRVHHAQLVRHTKEGSHVVQSFAQIEGR